MNRRRLAAVLAVTVPLALLSVALLVRVAPFWVDQARGALDRHRWPERREQIEAAAAGLTLPDGYRETDCGALGLDPDQRCWWTDALPADTAADLEAALRAAAATDVATETLAGDAPDPGRPVLVVSTGTVAGRDIRLAATREPDEEATLAAGELVLHPGSLVRLVADLDAPVTTITRRGGWPAHPRRPIVHVD